MRQLATIQKILKLEPIQGADKIVKATVLGWELVVKKDEFKEGDLCVYIEIDSQLPSNNPNFSFMADRKYRVKTIKLRGQISQGLALPLSILPDIPIKEGANVTELLGITKYDPQTLQESKLSQQTSKKKLSYLDKKLGQYNWYRRTFMKSNKKYNFPDFIKKTDETRLQNMPWILEKEKDTLFTVTEKIDGQSGTFFLKKNTERTLIDRIFNKNKYIFGVCSRNLWLYNETNSSYWTIAKQLNIKGVLESLIGEKDYIVLQGEIIGEGIQGNKYKVKGYDFHAFNLIYSDSQIDSVKAKQTLNKYGIKFVPILESNFKLLPSVKEMIEYSEKDKSTLLNIIREGIVIRNNDKGISFKAINPKFLLKNNE